MVSVPQLTAATGSGTAKPRTTARVANARTSATMRTLSPDFFSFDIAGSFPKRGNPPLGIFLQRKGACGVRDETRAGAGRLVALAAEAPVPSLVDPVPIVGIEPEADPMVWGFSKVEGESLVGAAVEADLDPDAPAGGQTG